MSKRLPPIEHFAEKLSCHKMRILENSLVRPQGYLKSFRLSQSNHFSPHDCMNEMERKRALEVEREEKEIILVSPTFTILCDLRFILCKSLGL